MDETLSNLIRERKIWKILSLISHRFYSKIYSNIPSNRVEILKEDWDYLIILDACRYDMFKELNTIPGRLEKRISLGSSTREWLKKNFSGYYEDVIYISANPYISNVEFDEFRGTDHFYKVENVWDYGWREYLGTVPPEEVTKTALRVREKYPNKRIIIHYLQPHAPWIGETRVSAKELNLFFSTAVEWFVKARQKGIWSKAYEKKIDLKLIKRAYKDNLELVLKEVERLVVGLDGKIVVTSDHGECFGEKFIIEHPSGIHIKELVEVPWLIIEKTKKIDAEKRRTKRKIKELKVRKRI